jgi:hypothetical protein
MAAEATRGALRHVLLAALLAGTIGVGLVIALVTRRAFAPRTG